MCHIEISYTQAPILDEEHGDVLDNVHHGLLEVRERVFDIIFAFFVRN